MGAKRCLMWGIAILPSWFTRLTRKNEQVMAPDDQQVAALQAYFEMMSELFLRQKLDDVKPGDDARHRALAHTATVLRSVDVARRATLIRFLSQSGLVLLGIGTDLQTLNLSGADLSHLTLGKVRLSEANLSHAKLMSGDLRGADLKGANLSWADLRGAKLGKTDLRGADLSRARLVSTNLGYAILSRTKLISAILRAANLSRAYLGAADLSGADLSGAALRDASVTQEQVHQARPGKPG